MQGFVGHSAAHSQVAIIIQTLFVFTIQTGYTADLSTTNHLKLNFGFFIGDNMLLIQQYIIPSCVYWYYEDFIDAMPRLSR